MTYQLKPILKIPVRWVTEITHVVEPILFVDEQRFGPYRFWHHQHHFRKVHVGVEVLDLVHYALFYGPLGYLANKFLVGKQLNQIFNYRRQVLVGMFGSLP